MIDEEVRKLIEKAYQITKSLLIEKREEVEKLAKELLKKEVLFKSDVEALIGKRPFEEKKALDIIVDEAEAEKNKEREAGHINDSIENNESSTPPAV